jgi:REP element-mobilizing transposase RayT
MAEPLAYFITFRTYGTWLHGDERGSVDAKHAGVGQEPLSRDDYRAQFERRGMKHPPFMLDPASRAVVETTIREVCSSRRWSLSAINVRTNHVHLVVSAEIKPELVMNSLKSWCTRRLREVNMVVPDARLWSRHGSTRYLWVESDVERARAYVVEAQDARP